MSPSFKDKGFLQLQLKSTGCSCSCQSPVNGESVTWISNVYNLRSNWRLIGFQLMLTCKATKPLLKGVFYLVDYKKFINLEDVLSRCVLSVSPCRPANSSFHLFYWQGGGNLSGQLFRDACGFPAISFLVFRKCMCVCSLIFGPWIENGSFFGSLSIFSAHSPDKIPCKSETFVIFAWKS